MGEKEKRCYRHKFEDATNTCLEESEWLFFDGELHTLNIILQEISEDQNIPSMSRINY